MFDSPLSKDFKHRRLKRNKVEIEPQEVFLDTISKKKELELGIPERRLEVPLSKKIFQGIFIAFSILMLFFLAKTFQLQVLQGEEYSLKAKEQSQRIYYLRPERGVIYDHNLKQLVWNKPSFDLVADIRDLPQNKNDYTRILGEIAGVLGEPLEDIEEKIEKSDEPQILISENISHDALIFLETKINLGVFPGFKIEKNIVRDYSNVQSLSHLIGYTGRVNREELAVFENYSPADYIGKTGVEKFYEEILRGKPGNLQIEKDAFGEEKRREILSLAEAGQSLVLWLDVGLQEKIEEELEKILEEVSSKKAVAVALDPRTGGVLALVNIPSFDANLFSQGISAKDYKKITEDPLDPLFNRVVAGLYPTGSTIKPLVASAALQENLISPEREINCQGEIQIPNPWNPEIIYRFRDWKVHGWTDLRKAIAESCNVYFYTIGGGYQGIQGLGAQTIKKYLQLFGWGKIIGIDIPGEKAGLIPDKNWKKEYFTEPADKIWMPGDTYNLSIGQGYISVTPLQVASAFSAVANRGKLLQPKVVEKIIDEEKNLVKEIKPEVIRENFIDSKNLQVVREGMRGAVTYGSSVTLNDLEVEAAAKTGTAQSPKEDYFHNWVTVFAPYDDPQIVLTILIEDVKGMRPAALPVAKAVLKWYFK